MQTRVETSKGLERKLTVQLPAQQYQQAYDAKLQSAAKSARVDGFRAGKVPLKVVQQRYGAGIQQEVLSDMIERSYGQAVASEKLRPAGRPQIQPEPLIPGQDVKYTAVFEIYPDVKLGDFKKLKVEKPLVDIQAVDIDKLLDNLRKQRATFEVVTRASQQDDQVLIDFEGSIDGELFDGGKGEKVPMQIGSGRLIEGFEEQLKGLKAGDEREVKVTFPKDYANVELQGKKAVFKVKVYEVSEQRLPEVNAEFVKSFGIEEGGVEKLQQDLREHMERELKQNREAFIKKQVMNGLAEIHTFDVPAVMVDQEIQYLQEQSLSRMGIKDLQANQLPREPYQEEATRRVLLGLIIAEVVKQHDLKSDPAKVRAEVELLAANYGQPEQIVQYYYNNPRLLQSIEAGVLEATVVEWILAQAKVSEKAMDFDALTKANQASK
ncbi:MAG: trigger factor [Gammaproteobacteria bacterium]|nr:trigger factor [Gammaproteobacteria bacterium]